MRKSSFSTYQAASRAGSGDAIAVCSSPRNIKRIVARDYHRGMSPRWMAVAGAGLLAIAAAAFFALRGSHTAHPMVTQPVQAVAPQPAPAEISLSGKIQATKVMNVAAPVDGAIEQFVADVGDDLAEGEVLARIKDMKLENAQEKLQLEVERAENQVSGLVSAVVEARG